MATPTLTPFELVGADAGPLRGETRVAGTDPRPGVVICHGFKGFKDWGFFPTLADRLAVAGLATVSFNFSGSGVGPDNEMFSEPERFGRATYLGDLADLETVLDAAREGALGPRVPRIDPVGLFGHSRGGGVAILRAAGASDIRALVTWAAISKPLRWGERSVADWRATGSMAITNARTGDVLPLYTNVLDEIERHGDGRLDVLGAASRVSCPWLLVHGEVDEAVPLAEGRALAERNAAAQILTVPHGGHTLGARHPWIGSTRELDTALDATVDWFGRHLFG